MGAIKRSLAVFVACLAMSSTSKASVFDFTFTSTIIVAGTPLISVGDTLAVNILLNNGGSTLVSQTWSGADAIAGFTLDAGSYHASYSTLFPGWHFQTDATGALIVASFAGTDPSSNNQDNFASFTGDVVFGGPSFDDSLGRSNIYATGFDTLANWTVAEATPIPATLPLFASGLGALGLFRWRRTRLPA